MAVMAAAPASAAGASPWSEDARSAIRLIAGTAKDGAPLRAGIEIKMDRGWHTYWRYPGDAGIPPRFDFSGSENVAAVTVQWPAPRALTEASGTVIAYKDNVIFPLRVEPKDKTRPVKLDLKADYAVCEKLCIPAQGAAKLALGAGDTAHEEALKQAEASVPKPASAEEIGLTLRRAANSAKPQAIIGLPASIGPDAVLFVEGPTPEWALPIPQPVADAPSGRRQFKFELDGLPPGTDPNGQHEFTITVVANGMAHEIKSRLD